MADTHFGTDTQQHRTHIHDLVARISRFITSTAVILLLLIGVTEQSIREYQAAVYQQSRMIREARKDLPRLRDQLGPRAGTARQLAGTFLPRVPRLDSMKVIDPNNDVDQRSWCAAALDTLVIRRIQVERNLVAIAARRASLERKLDRFKVKVGGHRTLDTLRAVKRGARWLLDSLNTLSNAAGRGRRALLPINGAIAAVQLYQATYGAIWSRHRTIDVATASIEGLRTEKRSLPTPFGSFELNPRVALFGLTAATAITYLAFVVAVGRLRSLLRNRTKRTRGDPLFASVSDIPYWLYSLGPDVLARRPASLREKMLTSLAFSVHLTWISGTIWLAFESIGRWNVIGVIRTDVPALVRYLIWTFAGMAVTAGLWLHLTSWVDPPLKRAAAGTGPGGLGMMLRRRRFLGVGSAGIVFGLVAFFCNRRIYGRPARRKRRLYARDLSYKGGREWVANDRTRVLHHVVACADHLPKDRRVVPVTSEVLGYTVHAGCETKILEALADHLLPGIADRIPALEGAGQLALEQGIEWDRYSYRLYDKLIRASSKDDERMRVLRLLNRQIAYVDRRLYLLLSAVEFNRVVEASARYLRRVSLFRERDRKRRNKQRRLINLYDASRLTTVDRSVLLDTQVRQAFTSIDMVESELASTTPPKTRRERLLDRRSFRARGRADLIEAERLKRARCELLLRRDRVVAFLLSRNIR